MLKGLMQEQPLLISSLIEHAARLHPQGEIVSRTSEGPIHRCTYADIRRRACQLANALTARGVGAGERIATLAWNGYRHMELYYGVSGLGAVLHTINPRLFPEQIEYIVNHAEDRLLFFDPGFLPLVEKLAARAPGISGYVVLTDRAHMPASSLPDLLCYEELLGGQSGDFAWPQFDENSCLVALLHLGDDRQPERRALLAPLVGTAFLGRLRGRRTGRQCAARRSCWSCRCSTSTPGECPTPAR
jgi:acyl-CoA synthetase (AMP-forming)/AMP-acid ligase II